MGQKQINFNTALKKGEIGELIVRKHLEERGWVVYFPFTKNKPHYFDMLATKNKENVIAVDVKTKARLNIFPGQGINFDHYNQYMRFAEKSNVPFWLIFVDEITGDVHAAEIQKLKNAVMIAGGKIIAWRLDNMKLIKKLSETEMKALQSYSQRNYEFKPENNR